MSQIPFSTLDSSHSKYSKDDEIVLKLRKYEILVFSSHFLKATRIQKSFFSVCF